MSKALLLVLMFSFAHELIAQDDIGAPQTRADVIQAERRQKAAAPPGADPSRLDRQFMKIENFVNSTPLRIGVGGPGVQSGLPQTQGNLAVGVIFQGETKDDRIRGKASAAVSTILYYNVGLAAEVPRLGSRDFSLLLEGYREDNPRIDYYGPGPDSSIDDRTDFRREFSRVESSLIFKPQSKASAVCRFAKMFFNVGPGTGDNVPPTQSIFGPAQAPGIDVQSDYLVPGCAVYADLRDRPGDPHQGSYFSAAYDRYHAEDQNRFSFHRLSAVGEHYFSFLNLRRVIALRAKTELNWHSADQVVPFYLQPTLGGNLDLRGFRRWRFYDENSIVLTAEYRYPVSTGLDIALFVDSGKVFRRPGDISLSGLETDGGVGFRFKGLTGVALRVDTGFSREGVHIWIRFGRLF